MSYVYGLADRRSRSHLGELKSGIGWSPCSEFESVAAASTSRSVRAEASATDLQFEANRVAERLLHRLRRDVEPCEREGPQDSTRRLWHARYSESLASPSSRADQPPKANPHVSMVSPRPAPESRPLAQVTLRHRRGPRRGHTPHGQRFMVLTTRQREIAALDWPGRPPISGQGTPGSAAGA